MAESVNSIAASQARLDEIVRAGVLLYITYEPRRKAGESLKEFLEGEHRAGGGCPACGAYLVVMGTSWLRGDFLVPGGPPMTVEQAEIVANVRTPDGDVLAKWSGVVPQEHEA